MDELCSGYLGGRLILAQVVCDVVVDGAGLLLLWQRCAINKGNWVSAVGIDKTRHVMPRFFVKSVIGFYAPERIAPQFTCATT